MASQTAGIQQLLAAEKRAADKINEARKRKAQRLKQAKQEAQAEIEKYREVKYLSFQNLYNLFRNGRSIFTNLSNNILEQEMT